MGSSSQSPPTQTTSVQTTELPDFVQAPAQSYLARAQDLSTQPFTSYEGERVAHLIRFTKQRSMVVAKRSAQCCLGP